MNSRSPLARAFSLLELLVVLAIACVLFTILLPAMKAAREAQKTIRCKANLHQIGLAFHMYATDNNGSFPSWSGWQVYPDGSSPYDSPGLGWVEELAPYVHPSSSIYNCPTCPYQLFNYFIEAEWAGINGKHSIRISDIKNASCYIVAGECTQPSLYPPPWGTAAIPDDDCDRDDSDTCCLAFVGDGGFLMHPSGNAALFADGHVTTFLRYEHSLLTFHPHRMESWQEVRDGGPDTAG